MADETSTTTTTTEQKVGRVLTGRRRIMCSEPVVTRDNLIELLGRARIVAAVNSGDASYLHDYFLGRQPVLERTKEVRESINNKVVENRAYQLAKDRADALVGEPITYSAHGSGYDHGKAATSSEASDETSHRVQRLNDACTAADKHACDLEMAQWLCEVGVAYRIVLPTPDVAREGAERPFAVASLDPRSTFVVRRNDVFREPLFAVTATLDEVTGERIETVYTDAERFVVRAGRIESEGPNPLGMVPIIEYEANPERMGIFEPVLSLFDAINEIESNRVDGVAQFVQALIVLENVDIDEEEFKSMLSLGAVKIASRDDLTAKVSMLTAELNQDQTQTLVDSFYKTALSICGMPFNVGGSASTSDTGAAVTMRDGWSNSENRCKETEALWKRSERRFLDAALSILDVSEHLGLKNSEVEIKFTRRNYEAIQSKAQVLTTLLGCGKVHPRLAFEHCGMFSDPESAYDLSEAYVAEQREIQAEQFAQQATTGDDAGSDSANDKSGSDKAANGKGTRPPSSKRSQEGDS